MNRQERIKQVKLMAEQGHALVKKTDDDSWLIDLGYGAYVQFDSNGTIIDAYYCHADEFEGFDKAVAIGNTIVANSLKNRR